MLIKVLYQNNEYDVVNPLLLDKLIASGKIKKFLRSEGWATIGIDPIRGTGGYYGGPERRDKSLLESLNDEDKTKDHLLDELKRLRHRVDELELLETENRKLADELRVSENKFRTVADFTSDWDDWMDRNGKCIYVSPSCERITGYSVDEFMLDPNLRVKIIHPDDRDILIKHYNESLKNCNHIFHIDFRIITHTGEVRWINHYCQPVHDKDGNFLGRRSSSRDITERKQAEEKIQKLIKELELKVFELTEANKELDAFNHTVSHDLKVPLVIIGGFINRFLKKHSDKLDTKEKDMFHAIQEHTQEMERLIKDLLAFSHVGRQKIKPTEIDIGNLVNTVLDELNPLSEGRMIKYDIKTLPTVYSDQALIKQVFINLLSNAIKFTTNKKMATIEVGGWTEENENVYYVKDNGMGFNSQDSDKLFNVFQRLHGIEALEGSGIGLSIVQRIVNKHGGRVWAEGKVNEGSSFYFSLPNKILEDS
jgi:PAS domain S-box-containing protein